MILCKHVIMMSETLVHHFVCQENVYQWIVSASLRMETFQVGTLDDVDENINSLATGIVGGLIS